MFEKTCPSMFRNEMKKNFFIYKYFVLWYGGTYIKCDDEESTSVENSTEKS
jgi:hypothetical protein